MKNTIIILFVLIAGMVSAQDSTNTKPEAYLESGRIFIAPNCNAAAVAERKAKGIKASMFATYDAASKFQQGADKQELATWDKDKYEQGCLPKEHVLVLEKYENNIYKTAFLNDAPDLPLLQDNQELQASYAVIKEQKQNINIMFVIDGTKSNHASFAPTINAIKNSVYHRASGEKCSIGTVIYGNHKEGILAEKAPVFGSHSSVIKTLKSHGNKQYIPQDNDEPTAMYQGIESALDFMENPDASNIIILIGDAGNTLGADNNKVIQKMKNKQCGFIAIQTQHKQGLAGRIYNEFVGQSKNIVMKSSITTKFRPKLYQNTDNTFSLKYPDESIVPGSITYANMGSAISPSELEETLSQTLTSLEKQHQEFLRQLDCLIHINCPDINIPMIAYLKKHKSGEFKHQTSQNQLPVEAFAPLHIKELKYPLFSPVLLMTREELSSLYSITGSSTDALRTQVLAIYKNVLSLHYDKNPDTTILNKTDMELPFKSELLTNYSLKDLENKEKISDKEIYNIFIYADEKRYRLRKVIGNPDYSFRFQDNTYYWVPLDMIP